MLTDAQCRKAKPKEKSYKIYAESGLYLLVNPNGSKLWQMKYVYGDKARTYSIGPYGDGKDQVTLAEAREKREEAKKILKEGRDPTLVKRLNRIQTTTDHSTLFEDVAQAWLEKNRSGWAPKHATDVASSFKKEVYPAIGRLPMAEITSVMIMKLVLAPIEKRGTFETAHRIRQRISAVFRYAAALGLVPREHDPAGPHLLQIMKPVPRKRPQPAITELEPLREMLRKAEEYPCHPTTKLAMRFVALTAVRVATMSGARWEQFVGLDGLLPIWEIPAEQMKGETGHKLPFTVPLCRQAVEVIEAAQRINGQFPWVFPNDIRPQKGPISNNAVIFHLYRVGYRGKHTAHGFRASFSTILNERHSSMRDIINFALAHVPKDEVEAAYNRAKYLEERRRLHQEYADLLLAGFPSAFELLDGRKR
ncbi:tyrosine-type recombinase/integrase [Belnapia rosea]|uniref:Integrase n=1 Tax=Belnapia rosea TaxID=938405 RepID=A0A1G6VRR8_9PROT|nr:integrase arm-type DNA-binding domain-containing protein [Belnapia rosea]SDD56241.1 Integrase [Belnapia rosea]